MESYNDLLSYYIDSSNSGMVTGPGQYSEDCGLPFEPLDEFSDAPLEFEEIAQTLYEGLQDLYLSAARANRHSAGYQVLCGHLEKNIRLAGSMCLTKAVLERKGLSFPSLEALSVKELYTMVSLHFRKTGAAFRELRDSGKGLDMSLLDSLCRWAFLAERLKATEEKILGIRSGKIPADSLLRRAEVFRGEPRGSHPRRDPNAIRRAASLPVIGSYARDLVREKQRKEAERQRELRILEREAYSFEKPFPPLKGVRISGMKKALTGNTGHRGDIETMKQVSDEDLRSVPARPQKEPGSGSVPPPRPAGLSDETRRKLREQRKKKKK